MVIAVIAVRRKDIKAAYQRSLIRKALSNQKTKTARKRSLPPISIPAPALASVPAPAPVPALASIPVLNPAPTEGVMEENTALETTKQEESPQ